MLQRSFHLSWVDIVASAVVVSRAHVNACTCPALAALRPAASGTAAQLSSGKMMSAVSGYCRCHHATSLYMTLEQSTTRPAHIAPLFRTALRIGYCQLCHKDIADEVS